MFIIHPQTRAFTFCHARQKKDIVISQKVQLDNSKTLADKGFATLRSSASASHESEKRSAIHA